MNLSHLYIKHEIHNGVIVFHSSFLEHQDFVHTWKSTLNVSVTNDVYNPY